MKAAAKSILVLVLLLAGAGVLVIWAAGARARGRLSYCRNNLRKLGEMAHQKLVSGNPVETAGRAFWQEVRVENFSQARSEKNEWFIKFGGLNPFGCPVRGVQPLNLGLLSKAELERHMNDPATIDYRGPAGPPGSPQSGLEVLGADRDGNHPHGGHVLLLDLSVTEVRRAVVLREAAEVPDARSKLSD
jgi:hypothetical protein